MPAREIFEGDGGAASYVPSAEGAEHLRLANILDQMPVGIGIFDKGGQLFHANRHFSVAAGGALTCLSQMDRASWRPIAHDGTPIDTTSYPPARALNGQIATPGMNFIRALDDGREHWVAMSAVPLTAPDQAGIIGVVVVAEDGESRRLHAEQLRAKEEIFQRFAKHSSNALWIANIASRKMDYLSPAAAKIWQHPDRIDTLDALESHVHGEDLPQLKQYRHQAITGTAQHFEYRLVDEGGDVTRRVREICFPIPGEKTRDEDCIGGIIEDVTPEVQIYLVQHDADRIDLATQLAQSARRIKQFRRAEDFMNVADVLNPGCVVLDLRGAHPAQGSVAELLRKRPDDLQVILIGSSDTPIGDVMAAMRAGAIDFLIDPVDPAGLAQAVRKAIEALPSTREVQPAARSDLTLRLSALPRREREVLIGLVSGGTNKMIARTLGISPRTVEVHRAHLMERLNVRNLSELLKMAHDAGLKPA